MPDSRSAIEIACDESGSEGDKLAGGVTDVFAHASVHLPAAVPIMDPLVPAIVQAVAFWGRDGQPVSIVHDQHSTLTGERIAQLRRAVGDRQAGALRRSASGGLAALQLVGLRLVESLSDPRVQVADFLAGVARKLASDELSGRPDGELSTLLRPYLDPFSIWDPGRTGRPRLGECTGDTGVDGWA